MNNDYSALLERVKREYFKAVQQFALADGAATEKERLEHIEYARKYSKRVASGIECYFKLTGHANEYGELDRFTL